MEDNGKNGFFASTLDRGSKKGLRSGDRWDKSRLSYHGQLRQAGNDGRQSTVPHNPWTMWRPREPLAC